MEIFDGVVGLVHDLHVVSPNRDRLIGKTWDEDLPAFREEMAAAQGEESIELALDHLINALHDPHVTYSPPSRRHRVRLGITFDVEWVNGQPQYYVLTTDDPAVALGDILVTYDNAPASSLETRFVHESRGATRRTIVSDVARFLGQRDVRDSTVLTERAVSVTTRRRTSDEPHTSSLRFSNQRAETEDSKSAECSNLPSRDYGDYRVAARGDLWCLYVSATPERKGYPIVRAYSFNAAKLPGDWPQQQKAAAADRDDLRRRIIALKPRGVLVDVRDNRGGSEPYPFLRGWAPRSFAVTRVERHLHARLRDRAILDGVVSGGKPDDVTSLLQTADSAGMVPPILFGCRAPDCDVSTGTYHPGERWVPAPMALLTGPDCLSACDQLAWVFDQAEMGPIVGQPGASATSVWRARLRVPSPDGKELGTFGVTMSQSRSGITGEILLGLPIHVDVPIEPTFENRARYDRMLVDAAIGALSQSARKSSTAVSPVAR